MPAGDQITLDDQFEYAGLLFGVGTAYRVVELDLGDPEIINTDQDAVGDGQHPGVNRYGPRLIVADLEIISDPISAFTADIDSLRTAMTLQPAEIPWVFRGYLYPDTTKRSVDARPQQFRPLYNRRAALGRVLGVRCVWKATHPAWEAL